MKITQHFESGEVTLDATIETKNLQSHSRMQKLTEQELKSFKDRLFLLVSDLTNDLLDRESS